MGNMNMTGFEVAVIGMSARFPGANDIASFWNNLLEGKESIKFLSDDELKERGVNPELINKSTFVNCAGGEIDKKGDFDAQFFGFSPNEANAMDPQMRLFMEYTWLALEDAGYDPDVYNGKIGTFSGASPNPLWEAYTEFSGKNQKLGQFHARHLCDKDFIFANVTYKLNLKGPGLTLYTACSTSLATIHLAAQSLINGECEMAVAGGVTAKANKAHGYEYVPGMVYSKDGHCSAFDDESTGVVFGEGVGIVVLKRYEDAIADGDNIYAIIKGSAINNDGNNKVGLTAPSVDGQASAIKSAISMAEISVNDIVHVEAHGTGTELGDVIEMQALIKAFNTSQKTYCGVGSVKSNIGHLDSAAGVAGFIKSVLILKNKVIPPTINFTKPNSKIDFANSPFYICKEKVELKNNSEPLKVGVSSFGIGGTNVHIILEEDVQKQASDNAKKYNLLVLSAKNSKSIDNYRINLANNIIENKERNITDVAYTLATRRKMFNHRALIVCSDNKQAADELNADYFKSRIRKAEHVSKDIVFVFSGQGAQYVHMAKDLYLNESVFKEKMDECFRIYKNMTNVDLKNILYPSDNNAKENINSILYSGPVKFSIEYCMAQQLLYWGINPKAMIGHSFGEYTAGCVAGVFSLIDAFKLIVSRANLLQSTKVGMMISVPLSSNKVSRIINNRNVSLAAINSPNSCILSGAPKEVNEVVQKLKEEGIECVIINVPRAGHSELMRPIYNDFKEIVATVKVDSPIIPYTSGVTGKWVTYNQITDADYWCDHLVDTNHFFKGIECINEELDPYFIQLGSDKGMALFIKQINDKFPIVNLIPHPKDDSDGNKFLFERIGELWSSGIEIEWFRFYQGQIRKKVSLPGYSFDHQSYSIGDNREVEGVLQNATKIKYYEDINDWFYLPSWSRNKKFSSFKLPKVDKDKFLLFINESEIEIANSLRSNGNTVYTVFSGKEFKQKNSFSFSIDRTNKSDYKKLWEIINKDSAINRIVHLWSLEYDSCLSTANNIDKELEIGFHSLMNITQTIGENKTDNRINIHVITNNSVEVIGTENVFPEKILINGIVQTIPIEYPNIDCTCIDLDIRDLNDDKSIKILNAIIFLMNSGITHLQAVRSGFTWKQNFEKISIDSPISQEITFKENGNYIITGGLGGIGFVITEFLARVYKANVLLLGRTELPPKEEWENYLLNSKKEPKIREYILKFKRLLDKGTSVNYRSVDVSNLNKLKEVVNEFNTKWGAVNGIVHSAGIPDGTVIQRRTIEITNNVLRAKVIGAINLDNIFSDKNLDFLVYFSSRNAFIPAFAHAAHSSANAFLDSFSLLSSRNLNYQVKAINWNGWKEVGQAADIKGQYDNSCFYKSLSHPLLNNYYNFNNKHVFQSILNIKHWLLKEHMVGNTAVLVGTAYIELIISAIKEVNRENEVLLFEDVFFLTPLMVKGNIDTNIETILQKRGEKYEFKIVSYNIGTEIIHVKGVVKVGENLNVNADNTQIILENVQMSEYETSSGNNNGMVSFGEHWINNIIRIGNLGTNTIKELELPDTFIEETNTFNFHPSLMDCALGVSSSKNVYLPFHIKKLYVVSSIPSTITSHLVKKNIKSDEKQVSHNALILDKSHNILVYIEEYTKIKAAIKDTAPVKKGNKVDKELIKKQIKDFVLENYSSQTQKDDKLLSREGLECFIKIMETGYQRLVVSKSDLNSYIESKSKRRKDLSIANEISQPEVYNSVPRPEIEAEYIKPNTNVEKILEEIFINYFGYEKIGVNDDFFQLGGDSLKAIFIINSVYKKINIRIPIPYFFSNPTIGKLSEFMSDVKGEQKKDLIFAQEKKEYYRLSSLQKNILSALIINPESSAYNVLKLVEIQMDIDEDSLCKSLKKLIKRHEVLRTYFKVIDNDYYQIITNKFELDVKTFNLNIDLNNIDIPLEEIIYQKVNEPIDIHEPLLMRFKFVVINNSTKYLFIALHHIITDATSVSILESELRSLLEGNELKPINIHFKDCTEYQYCSVNSDKLNGQKKYWLSQFEDTIPVLELPTDKNKSNIPSTDGGVVKFAFDANMVKGIKSICEKQELTFFMFLLASFKVFLSKICSQDDILVGVPVVGRRNPILEHVVGMFVNILPIRSKPTSNKTFLDFLAEIKSNILKAYENQEYALENVEVEHKIKEGHSKSYKMDVLFNFLNQKEYSELSINNFQGLNKHSKGNTKYDLNFKVFDLKKSIFFFLEYNSQIFVPATIDKFIQYFKIITQQLIEHPEMKISDVQIVDDNWRIDKINDFNSDLKLELKDTTIQGKLISSFENNKDSIAITCGECQYSYKAFYDKVNTLSYILINRFNILNRPVAILVSDDLLAITSIFSVLLSRGVFVPVDTSLPDERIRLMFNSIDLELIITDNKNCNRFLDLSVKQYNVQEEHIGKEIKTSEVMGLKYLSEDSIYIYFTSGTTGEPKAILGKNESLSHFIQWEQKILSVNSSVKVSQLNSKGFDAYLRDVFLPLSNGGTIYLKDPNINLLDPLSLVLWIDKHKINVIHCVPSLFKLINQGVSSDNSFRSLKYILMSGEFIPINEVAKWHKRFGDNISLINLYGATETTMIKSYHFITKFDIENGYIPIGKPISGTKMVVVDKNGNLCDIGMKGEILVRTAYSTYGYCNLDESFQKCFVENPFHSLGLDEVYKTGDLGVELDDGSFRLLGRIDSMIKINGVRVEPGEVELKINELPYIKESRVIINDFEKKSSICAYFVANEKIDIFKLKKDLIKYLPQYMLPKYFLQLDKFPLLSNGKVNVNEIPEIFTSGQDICSPKDEVEETITKICAEVLGMSITDIGTNISLFELGVDSLEMISIIAKIEEKYNYKFSFREIYIEPFISVIADKIKGINNNNNKGQINEIDLEEVFI